MTLEQWLDPWKYKSTDVQQRVKLALEFLERHYGAAREEKILREIKCIDFSHPVSLPTLFLGTILVGSKDPRASPYRAVYFTKVGASGASIRGRLRRQSQLPRQRAESENRRQGALPIQSGCADSGGGGVAIDLCPCKRQLVDTRPIYPDCWRWSTVPDSLHEPLPKIPRIIKNFPPTSVINSRQLPKQMRERCAKTRQRRRRCHSCLT